MAPMTRRAEAIAAVAILRGPKRTPIEQVIAGFRTAEILNRRPPRSTTKGDAFDLLAMLAENRDLTILEYLDTLEIPS